MQIKGNRLLVIGGAGFIGSHVVDQLLSEGAAHVRVYDNFSRGTHINLQTVLTDVRTEIFADGGDILHADTLINAMDGVFHLAALWLLQCYEYPRSVFEVNDYGSRQDDKDANVGVIVKMLNALDAVKPPIIHGHGSQFYDFIDVRDCARANVLAMQATSSNQYYNVGTCIKTSIAERVDLLSIRHPNKISARFELGGRPFIRNRVNDTEMASREINFSAEIGLDVGLCEYIPWWNHQKFGVRS